MNNEKAIKTLKDVTAGITKYYIDKNDESSLIDLTTGLVEETYISNEKAADLSIKYGIMKTVVFGYLCYKGYKFYKKKREDLVFDNED